MRNFLKRLLVLTLLASSPALGADTLAPGLSGDWGGARNWLFDRGLDLRLRYASELAFNITGGKGHALRQAGQTDADVGIDLHKLVGLAGGKFQLTLTHRNGNDLGTDMDLGTLQLVQEVYGRGNVLRLTQLWYDQSFWDGLLDWKIGRITVGEDTADFPCDFQNLTFCGAQPGNIVGNYWFNWPVSQWGTRLRLTTSMSVYVQLSAYEINPNNLKERFSFSHSGATGVMFPLELGWKPKFAGGRLAGSYKVGVWYDTSDADDVLLDVNRQPQPLTGAPALEREGRYGAYAVLQQQVTHDADAKNSAQGLGLFLRVTQADRQTSATDNQLTLGACLTGFFHARPDDDLGLALGRTNANSRAVTRDRLAVEQGSGTPVRRAEYVGEVYYSLHATPWLTLRPNFQYILHPGARSDADNVTIVGLKAAVVL